jgi:hypothetical protein
MTSDTASALPLLTVQAHCEHALRLDFESNFIAGNNLALGHSKAAFSTNSDGSQWRGLNATNTRRTTCWKPNGTCGDGEIRATKGVGDRDLDLRGADRHVEGLAECRISENTSGTLRSC